MKRFIVFSLILSAILVSVTWGQIRPTGPSADMRALLQALNEQAGSAQKQVFYDDFRKPFIDTTKWVGGGIINPDLYFCSNPFTLDCGRVLENDGLRLALRTQGANDSDSGFQEDISYVNFKNPATVTTVTMSAVVTKSQGLGCLNNPEGALLHQLVILGSFFNIGSTSNPAEDVVAMVILGGLADNQNFTWAGAGIGGGFNYWQNFESVKLVGEKTMMSLRWDKANHRFVAGIKQRGTPPQVLLLPYSVPDVAPAAIPWKAIGEHAWVPNCTAQPTVSGVEAIIDYVLVNASAHH